MYLDLFGELQTRLPYVRVCEILEEAVQIETKFVKDSLPWKLPNMNAPMMSQYVQYVADTILTRLNYPKYYQVNNPFTFMLTQGMDSKGNFFETESINYQQAGVRSSESDKKIAFDEEF